MRLEDIYSETILRKAEKLVSFDEDIIETDNGYWLVKGSNGKPYRLYVTELDDEQNELEPTGNLPWVTCECPNGQARGGRPGCYHSAAVMLSVIYAKNA